MTSTLLLCTVGGSHQPILTAIREIQPAHVLFFCTGRDPATGRPGSVETITGRGTPVEVRRGAEVIERLANIPTQAGLAAECFDVAEVPADDLDGAVAIMMDAIAGLRSRFADAELVADYTGGTKTMTAALVISALESDEVALQLVTGTRGDLTKVHDGSQYGLPVSAEGIRLRRAMSSHLGAWKRFAYAEAADGLEGLRRPRDPRLRADLQVAIDLSRAFDAWDRFDHATALRHLVLYRTRIGHTHGLMLTFLGILAASEDDPRRAPARLWDLWLNAQRRAAQGRYDDAVARLYRLLEWTAQWLLRAKGIDTADLTTAQIPASLQIAPNPDGKVQAGLFNAWALVAHHHQGPAGEFALQEREHMRAHLLVRNGSILAHGATPIDAAAWSGFSGWVNGALLPVLSEEAAHVGFRMQPPPLPQASIW
jgi:CRISPR-associated protein (TIGR02710 family)